MNLNCKWAISIWVIEVLLDINIIYKFLLSSWKRVYKSLACWENISVIGSLKYFSYFVPENQTWHFMQIVRVETNSMKGQVLFSSKNKEKIFTYNLSSAVLAYRVIKLNIQNNNNKKNTHKKKNKQTKQYA